MPHKKKSFVFYGDWLDAILEVECKDTQLGVFIALAKFALDGEEPADKNIKTLFNFMKGTLERDALKYQQKIEKCSAAGRKHTGNQYTRAKGEEMQNGTDVPSPSIFGTNGTVNVNDNVNVNDIDNNIIHVDEAGEIVEVENMDETIDTLTDKIPFDKFWDAYDKKNDRKQCEKKWNDLSKKQQEKAMEGVRIYLINQPNKQYRRDPIRYLRDKMWNNSEICQNIYDSTTTNTNKPAGEGQQRRGELGEIETMLRKGQS